MTKPARTLRTVPPSPLKTASWWTPLPPRHVRVAISRGPLPERVNLNTMRYPALTPTHPQKNTDPGLFQKLYINRLATLDPEFILADLKRMAGADRVPVLCCYESARNIDAGTCGCHRHLAAVWFERALDIQCEEIGAPRGLDRFRYWNAHPIPPAVPGDRPRTGPAPTITKASRTAARLAQLKFKF